MVESTPSAVAVPERWILAASTGRMIVGVGMHSHFQSVAFVVSILTAAALGVPGQRHTSRPAAPFGTGHAQTGRAEVAFGAGQRQQTSQGVTSGTAIPRTIGDPFYGWNAVPPFPPDLAAILRRTLDSTRTYLNVPGVVAFVERSDGATWHGTSGVSDRDSRIPMSAQLKFRIASVTKTFTATIILQLAKEGLFSLDDTLESVLPGAMLYGSQVTIRQLLNHTSGYFDYLKATQPFEFLAEVWKNRERRWTPQELLAVANANPPYFAPGRGFHYSNTNYVLLGLIIERTTGRTYAQNVTDRIILPLKLTDTSVSDADPHMPPGSTHTYFPNQTGTDFYDTTVLSASWMFATGNIISTAADLQKWLAAFLSGRLVSPQYSSEMFAVTQGDAEVNYGLGVELIARAYAGHTGDSVFAGQAAMYQGKGWRFVILINSSPANRDPTIGFGSEYILEKLVGALTSHGLM